MRRLPPALVVLPVLALVGCGAAPTGAAKARRDFLVKYKSLDDQQLAHLCPSLYPTDFLKRPKHYHYTRDKPIKFKFTPQQQADAKTAGCTATGTKPK